MAICSGSVSPSSSTMTGAHILKSHTYHIIAHTHSLHAAIVVILNGLLSNNMQSVSLGHICQVNCTCCHTKTDVAISSSHIVLTPGQLVLALTLHHKIPNWKATRRPAFKSAVWLDQGKWEAIPRPPAFKTDSLPPCHWGHIAACLTCDEYYTTACTEHHLKPHLQYCYTTVHVQKHCIHLKRLFIQSST